MRHQDAEPNPLAADMGQGEKTELLLAGAERALMLCLLCGWRGSLVTCSRCGARTLVEAIR
jgi:hypothetical protein